MHKNGGCCHNKDKEQQGTNNSDIYYCPMHPEVRQIGPGICPICGMDLEPIEEKVDEEGPSPELIDMTRRFKWAAILTGPLLLVTMSEIIPSLSLRNLFSPMIMSLIEFGLATPVVIWAGFPLFERGLKSIINRKLNMFTLIALGVGAAYIYSVVATFFPSIFPTSFKGHSNSLALYYEAAAVITTLVLLGQTLELRARGQTNSAIRALLKLAPKTARRIRPDGSEEDVSIELIKPGDHLRVRPGEAIPVDGIVIEGRSSIDESMITGESIPVEKTTTSQVKAGTINKTGSFIMNAERVGKDTLLSQIVKMVGEAQRSRAPIQRLADVTSSYFVPAVVVVAAIAAVIWGVYGPEPRLAYALVNAVAVLIIACPCALGLATPMSIMVGTGRGAQEGVLFKNAEALETLEKINTLVIDKTGTLTEGKPKLISVIGTSGFERHEILEIAAILEKASEHPLASAIISGAKEAGVSTIQEVTNFEAVPGQGVIGSVNGKSAALGNQKLMEHQKINVNSILSEAESLRKDGQTVMFVALDGKIAGIIGVADPIKETTADAIKMLKEDGINIVMLTGDNLVTAGAIAQKLGISEVKAEISPNEKASVIKNLQLEGKSVAMAGDGVNDAPALAQAQVGIAMGTGTDVAIQSAGVTLVKGDLRGIFRARRLSVITMRNIRQNLFFAFIYNILGVPIAAGVLYPFFGILLSPMIASAAMSLSSVSVIANALRLKRLKL